MGQIKTYLFLLIVASANAQSIKGHLVDKKTNATLCYANVMLYNAKNNKLITGTTSDLKGNFKINSPKGKYFVKAQVIGYELYISDTLNINDEGIDLGTIALHYKSITLNEVILTSKKRVIENQAGKQILNVNQIISTGGGNITNVIKLVPSVEITPRGNISIRGNDNVKVLINGREPAYGMSPETLLKQLPASTIEKVEIITNPSAKNDPENSGGVINIIQKKNSEDGLNIGFNLEVGGSPFRNNNGLILNYAKNKINAYLTYGYYKEKYNFSEDETTTYTNTQSEILQTKGDGYFQDKGHLVIGGFDYQINDHNKFNAELLYNNYKDDWTYQPKNKLSQSGVLLEETNVKNISFDHIDLTNLSLNYDFDDKHSQTLAVANSFSMGGVKDSRTITQSNNTSTDTTKITSDGRFYTSELLANYRYKISNKHTIETGINSDFLWFKTTQKVSTETDKIYKLFQHRQAVYATYISKFGKFSSSLGIRPEYYESKTSGTLYEKKLSKSYLSFFPNIKFQYDLGNESETRTLNLSYSKRIRRPSDEELDPITDYSNPSHLCKGNPELNPEFIHSIELNYNQIKGSTKVNMTLFGTLTNDIIQNFTESRDNNVLFTTYKNHSQSKRIGLEMNGGIKPFGWWEINPGGMILFSHYAEPADSTPYNKRGHSWNLKINNMVKLKSNVFELQAQYYGQNKKAFNTQDLYYQINLGYKRDIFKGIGEFKISINDIFNSGGRENYRYIGKSFNSDAKWRLDNRFLNVSLNFFIQ